MPDDKRITELEEETSPSSTDLVEVVRDPDGDPENVKVQIGNLPGTGGGSAISSDDGDWHAQGYTSAQDSFDTASAGSQVQGAAGEIAVAGVNVGNGFAGAYLQAGAGLVVSAVDDGTPKLGFYGATEVAQPTLDSSDTDANRLAALEAILVNLGLSIDTA